MDDTLEMMKSFVDAEYDDKVVAFIDIMGVKAQIEKSEKPSDFLMYTTIMKMIKNQSFAANNLQFFAFSDCMYIIANRQDFNKVLLTLSWLAFCMLFDNSTKVGDGTENGYEDILIDNCFKVRGGITYGKVFVVPQNNMVFGTAPINAYVLEDKTAIYPRILMDDLIMKQLPPNNLDSFSAVKDEDGHYYFDFLSYVKNHVPSAAKDLAHIDKIIEYVEREIIAAGDNNHLTDQLRWYKKYLENHRSEQKE